MFFCFLFLFFCFLFLFLFLFLFCGCGKSILHLSQQRSQGPTPFQPLITQGVSSVKSGQGSAVEFRSFQKILCLPANWLNSKEYLVRNLEQRIELESVHATTICSTIHVVSNSKHNFQKFLEVGRLTHSFHGSANVIHSLEENNYCSITTVESLSYRGHI